MGLGACAAARPCTPKPGLVSAEIEVPASGVSEPELDELLLVPSLAITPLVDGGVPALESRNPTPARVSELSLATEGFARSRVDTTPRGETVSAKRVRSHRCRQSAKDATALCQCQHFQSNGYW